MNTDFIAVSESGVKSFVTKVFVWMAAALFVTGLVAYYTATSDVMLSIVFGKPVVLFGLILIEFLLVLVLSRLIQKMNSLFATAIFFLYSALNGVTLASIFLVYTAESIQITFFITAVVFGVMSLYGYFAKTDLTRFGNLFLMALIGIILASLVNLFLNSTSLYWAISYIGVIVFTGLVAYDTQKLKDIYYSSGGEMEAEEKASILGALALYLDFINLFLMLLRFFGKRR